MQPFGRGSWLAVIVASIGGFGLLLMPQHLARPVRAVVRDMAFPGLYGLNELSERARSLHTFVPSRTDAMDSQLAIQVERDRWEQKYRELQAVSTKLASELEQVRSGHVSPFLASPGTPLFVPELLAAKIIAAEDMEHTMQRVSYRRVLDVGSGQDIIPSDYVLHGHSDAPTAAQLIDQGEDCGIKEDQPVFAGRCVVGKIGQVGRWTSTVIPITDTAFRGRAQLIRTGPQGLVLGPEGVLAGTGDGRCILTHIAATQPVAVGDQVYTSSHLMGLPLPMYYGRVIKVNLPEGAPNWEIVVQPAESMDRTRVVQVLRTTFNPARATSDAAAAGDAQGSLMNHADPH